MFLNSYLSSNYKIRSVIDSFYSKIIIISRNKKFYAKLNVPDTLDGRFDLLALFSIICSFFLSNCGSQGKHLSQVLFDKIFLDLDLSLRELGAGDAGVHIKIKNMVSSYMGRQKVYCKCLEKKDFGMLEHYIKKNIYRNVANLDKSPEILTIYCKEIFNLFEQKDDEYFLSNKFNFPKIKN